MRWIRRAQAAWKRATALPKKDDNLEINMDRRVAIKGMFAIAAGLTLQSCAAFVTREFGFDREHSTRFPRSVRDVIEEIPKAGELEIGFIKERKAGKLVGASMNRTSGSTTLGYNNWKRDPRSTIHTHPVEERQDARIQTYPSANDMHWMLDRARKESPFPMTMRTIHIAPITREGKAMGICSVRLGKRWLSVEKLFPEFVERCWQDYYIIQRTYGVREISIEEYGKQINNWFKQLEPLGLQKRLTPYPGFQIKNGFIVSK